LQRPSAEAVSLYKPSLNHSDFPPHPMDQQTLRTLIRTVPDWPKPGICFFDICSIVEHAEAFGWTVRQFSALCTQNAIKAIVSPDARGFLWGSPVAFSTGLPLHLARKPGKLPGAVVTQSYDYEYATASISMQAHCALAGRNVLLLDDVLATGGTALAVVDLLTGHFGVAPSQITVAAVLNLKFLPGESRLLERGVRVQSLLDLPVVA
jgi:adenine phosphoribosyltransferase